MIDWSRSYNPTWRYFLVDCETWRDMRPLSSVTSCKVKFSRAAAIPEDVQVDVEDELPPESILRVYLDAEQDGVLERIPVATAVLTSRDELHGTVEKSTLRGYGTLMSLEDDVPALLATVAGGVVVEQAAAVCESGMAPVVKPTDSTALESVVVADPKASKLAFARAIAAKAGYDVSSDAYGRTVFPRLPGVAAAPAITLVDDGETVLVGDVKRKQDLRKVPNYCEVRVTNGTSTVVGSAVNDDRNSAVSTVARGRRVPLIIEDPDELQGDVTAAEVAEFAAVQLEAASQVACTVSYSHDYAPVNVGDCIRLVRGSLDVTAIVETMSISCDTSCRVEATASYIESYWRA